MTIPVHIIAGFLGSGKTTLLNHLLTTLPPKLCVALIVNDFGKVAVDGVLLRRSGYAVKEMPSGCVCCTLAGPLVEAVKAIVHEQRPDVIIMETTGVAIPGAIRDLLASSTLENVVRGGNTVCVVDAVSYCRYAARFPFLDQQVRQANLLIVNKLDLVTEAQHDATQTRISFHAHPAASVVETTHGAIDFSVLRAERAAIKISRDDPNAEAFHTGFDRVSWEPTEIFSREKFQRFLHRIAPTVVRGKGIIQTDKGAAVFQISPAGVDWHEWDGERDVARVLFIGDALDGDAIAKEMLETTI